MLSRETWNSPAFHKAMQPADMVRRKCCSSVLVSLRRAGRRCRSWGRPWPDCRALEVHWVGMAFDCNAKVREERQKRHNELAMAEICILTAWSDDLLFLRRCFKHFRVNLNFLHHPNDPLGLQATIVFARTNIVYWKQQTIIGWHASWLRGSLLMMTDLESAWRHFNYSRRLVLVPGACERWIIKINFEILFYFKLVDLMVHLVLLKLLPSIHFLSSLWSCMRLKTFFFCWKKTFL